MDTLNSSVLWNVINNLPYYIFWKDPDLVFQGCNRNFAYQFGFESVDDLVGKTDQDFPWSPELRDQYRQDDLAVMKSRSPKLNYEEEQLQEDGSVKTVLVSKVPMFDENSEVIGILGMYTDITHIKYLETIKRENDINLERVKSLKSLAGVIAHELRTPIASIRLGATALERILPKVLVDKKSNISAQEKNFVEGLPDRMKRQAEYCNVFIDMQLNNLNTEKIFKSDFSILNMRKVLDSALDDYPFQEGEQGLVHYGKCDFDFLGDETLTRHLIWNLLKNALFFINKAGKGEIFITSENKEGVNKVYFKDTSIGMPEDVVEHIFEGFYSRRSGGTGLGLAFCAGVMDAYNGGIACSSVEGEFSEFTLIFPEVLKS